MATATLAAAPPVVAGSSLPVARRLPDRVVRLVKDEGGETLVQATLNGLVIKYEYERTELSFWLQHPDTGLLEWVTVRPDFYLPHYGIFVECTEKRKVCAKRRRAQALMQYGHYVLVLDSKRLAEVERDPGFLKALIKAVKAQDELLKRTKDLEVREQIEAALAQLLSPFTPPPTSKSRCTIAA